MKLKACKKCGVEAEWTPVNFYGNGRPGILRPYCKACDTLAAKKRRARCKSEDSRKLFEREQRVAIKSKYGITKEQRDSMLEAQGFRCAICLRELRQFGYGAANVDHCHTTGRVRGVLCGVCNRSLGGFRDSPTMLRLAADYLEGSHATCNIRKGAKLLPSAVTSA